MSFGLSGNRNSWQSLIKTPQFVLNVCVPCIISMHNSLFGETLRDKLQRLQNRAARVLTNSNFNADASILLNELGWKNLETQPLINKALMV